MRRSTAMAVAVVVACVVLVAVAVVLAIRWGTDPVVEVDLDGDHRSAGSSHRADPVAGVVTPPTAHGLGVVAPPGTLVVVQRCGPYVLSDGRAVGCWGGADRLLPSGRGIGLDGGVGGVGAGRQTKRSPCGLSPSAGSAGPQPGRSHLPVEDRRRGP